jgi:hypothetical protein
MEDQMQDTALDLNALRSRLERLENENLRMKRTGVSCLVIFAAILAMGQAQERKVVEATQFNIRDSSGKVRGALGTFEGITQLTLYGPEGAQSANAMSNMVIVGNGPQGPYVTFTDAKGKERVELSLSEKPGSEQGLWLFNGDAQEVASLAAAGDSGRLTLGRVGGGENFMATVVPDYGPSLVLSDKGGFKTTVGTTDLQTPRTGQTHRSSAASVMLFGKDNKVLWSVP